MLLHHFGWHVANERRVPTYSRYTIMELPDHVYVRTCDFKMLPRIDNPADCKVRTVTGFLFAKRCKVPDIHL